MKKIFLIILLSLFFINPSFAFFKKKTKPVLLLSHKTILNENGIDETIKDLDTFVKNSRIYFFIYTKEGFKSNYIKYQIIKQDDKAHIGGYSRIRNINVRVKNKNYYQDYFTLSESGKYIIQIFDIENHHHWIAFKSFRVIDE